MSWFKPSRLALVTAMLLGGGTLLSACSFSPVYSGALAEQSSLNFAYDKPSSRLEQVIYQQLSLRLGSSTLPTAPLATISASSSAADKMVTPTTNLSIPVSVSVTATLTITARDGSDTKPRTFTRSASADYTRSGQVLADNAAASEAAERAAKGAAESLRLAVLAALSR